MPDVKESFLREVLEMEKIFSNLNLCIRGASVFIAVDRVTCKANIKLIDFGSIELTEEPDQGVILGLRMLQSFVK